MRCSAVAKEGLIGLVIALRVALHRFQNIIDIGQTVFKVNALYRESFLSFTKKPLCCSKASM